MKRKANRWLELFGDCLIHLSKNNVKLILDKKMVYIEEEDIYTQGYWDDDDEENLVLACCMSGSEKDWMPIFVHEYCHFLQYLEKSEVWLRNKNIDVNLVNKIYSNEYVPEKKMNECLDAIKHLELDCEKRVVKLLKEYKIPISTSEYIKQANAYVWFHDHIKTYRKWYPKNNPPYRNERVIAACSSKFHKSYDAMPKNLLKVFKEIYQ